MRNEKGLIVERASTVFGSGQAKPRSRNWIRLAILRFSISGEIIRTALRPRRARVQLRRFSAGSILTLRNKTEPLASTTSQQITCRTRDVANFDDQAIWFHFLHKRLQRRRRRKPPAKSMLATRRSHCLVNDFHLHLIHAATVHSKLSKLSFEFTRIRQRQLNIDRS